ncbi:kyphoscoliosis peptidase [Plakobranchus ocellatus]|uniref:Kyphoscoliosis peptidase n=1 Tax=Plakobranchus ocellatus TaxID=259542 RepID=A0AAV4BN13_9GAST|nr:kyphoscoliosis peptidase [Plakobranchus ocellatus]
MSERPEVPVGYLGSQPKFGELHMQALSHADPEFSMDNNTELEIKFKCPKPVKVTTNLINCQDDSENSEFVFTQTKDGVLSFVITLPQAGYFKFQVFALEASDESKSLPNVFNYLINVKEALKAAYPFPKQYAQWKEGCFLYSPLVLNCKTSLAKVDFKLYIPNAKAVAVVAAGEWFHLAKKDDNWEGTAALSKHRGKDVKVTVNANFGPDETKYATLLEYVI